MSMNNRKKVTKSQFLKELKESKTVTTTSNAYDLNENGGFVADQKLKLVK